MAVAMDESHSPPPIPTEEIFLVKQQPTDFSTCHIVITLLSGSLAHDQIAVELDKEVSMVIGSAQNELMDQVELAVLNMQQGELTQITLDLNEGSDTGNEEKVCQAEQDNACIIGIKLVMFQSAKAVWRLNPHEKFKRAQAYKTLGVELFKKCKLLMAFRKFSRALKYSILVGKVPPAELDDEVRKLKCQCYLNLGACQMQVQNYCSVIDNCSKALCLDSNSVKGLYRRAQALCSLDDYTSAVEDLKKAKLLEPGNKAVVRLLVMAEAKVKTQEEKMAQAMSKMLL